MAARVDADDRGWQEAAEAVERGELVAFPTDTVYGIGCDMHNPVAIDAVYQAKGRDAQKALPLLLSGKESVSLVAREVPESAQALMARFWPGTLTLVLPRLESLPSELGSGDTIAVRVPAHDGLRHFISLCGGAIASSSANISGKPDALDASQVEDYLGPSLGTIVDGGHVTGGVPSTVVDCTREPLAILRQGAIPAAAIESAVAGEARD